MGADLNELNEQQRNAVLTSVNKNVVLLAGAGSGKTKTMVVRTQYLIEDLGVDPENIMLVTFTNKAANEIMERISKATPNAFNMWIGTFHRICIRIIRLHGHKAGIKHFSILDDKGQKGLVKDILDDMGINYNPALIKAILSKIGEFKNNMRKPSEVLQDSTIDQIYRQVYKAYQEICWKRKTFDFDDLIIYSIYMITAFPDVAEWAHEKFKYIMADEVQDTNMAQFVFLNSIMGNNNVMLVGDISQSIYGFRNAKPQYLNGFAASHPNTVTLKLEQNYRSTKNIIYAANNVVGHNSFGSKVEMFCNNEEGEKIQLFSTSDPSFEAKWVASEIQCYPEKSLSDFAIIYRTNHQSRVIEEEFMRAGIAYTIFGSQSFYSRKEIKDMLAWLKLYTNPYDIDAFKRVASDLKGVGKVTVNNIVAYAMDNNLSMTETLEDYALRGGVKMTAAQIKGFATMNKILNTKYNTCTQVVEDIYDKTEIRRDLVTLGTEDAIEKVGLLDEFQDMVYSMENTGKAITMVEVIDQISILSDLKGEQKASANCVKLMTAHASKGLEFNTVFIIGAQEGSFPHKNAIATCTQDAIEEERRLFYVAMTRAQKKLYITHTTQVRNSENGGLIQVNASRFLKEIPDNLKEICY